MARMDVNKLYSACFYVSFLFLYYCIILYHIEIPQLYTKVNLTIFLIPYRSGHFFRIHPCAEYSKDTFIHTRGSKCALSSQTYKNQLWDLCEKSLLTH